MQIYSKICIYQEGLGAMIMWMAQKILQRKIKCSFGLFSYKVRLRT